MHPDLAHLLAKERIARMHLDAERRRLLRTAKAHRKEPPDSEPTVTLRLDAGSDADALRRLGELSSRSLPRGPFVVAEIDGRIDAAVPLTGGTALADPFRYTAHLLALLELRAAQIRKPWRRRRLGALLRLRSARP